MSFSIRTLGVGSRLAEVRWRIVALIVVAILGQVAAVGLRAAFVGLPTDGLVLYVVVVAISVVLTVPALVVVRWLDRRERESRWLYAFVLGWGMFVAAGLSIVANDATIEVLAEALSEPGMTEQQTADAAIEAFLVAVVFVAPFVEELAKGLALVGLVVFLRAQLFTMRDGLVFGALVGLGFNLLEAPFYVMSAYLAGADIPWASQLGARFIFLGLNGHALYSALFGIGLGLALQWQGRWRRIAVAGLGFVAAYLAHVMNNGLIGLATVLTLALLGVELDPTADDPFAAVPSVTFLVAFAIAWLSIEWWAYLIVAVALVRSARFERRVIAEELRDEVGHAVTDEEYALVGSEPLTGLRTVPGYPRRTARAIVDAQNKIAFLRWRARRDGRDPDADPLIGVWRGELARLRAQPD